MRYWHKPLTCVAAAAALLLSRPAAVEAAAPDGIAVASDKIRDMTAVLRVVDAETHFDELKKIGGAFATTYRFKRMHIAYKNPNKVRFESKILGANVLMVYNGNMKMFQVPLRKQVKNVTGKPGQKQSLLDLGIFAKDYLTTDYSPAFLRSEGKLHVYKLSQRDTDNRSHEIVWVDPATRLITRKLSFTGDGKLTKEMRFKNPAPFAPGVFVPTRLEIYNQFGRLAAVQAIEAIKVNQGVSDARFNIS